MQSTENQPKSVAIIGAGLVGSLASIYFAQRGWQVKIFEKRPDIRKLENLAHLDKRSINLALSQRGISALSKTGLGLDRLILSKVTPMKGRMIHDPKGKLISQAYGLPHQHINSVDRGMLNEELVSTAVSFKNVEILFEHNLKSCDLDTGYLTFSCPDGENIYIFDLIVGADGAYSRVRQEIMKKTRMDFSQNYIDHGYCELTIPPKKLENGTFEYAMDHQHLHIWPRHSYMMIALPNKDKSFTCTLFAPWSTYDSITTPKELLDLFEKDLSDAIPLIGRESIVQEYFKNPKGSLLTVRCKPYNYKGKAVIIGDAAHCMVPFYGQGMNSGFEDVETLFNLLDQYGLGNGRVPCDLKSMEQCLNQYNSQRYPDATAMCDLALYNYIEMRSSVVSYTYLIRKKVESFLHGFFPSHVIPLYTMISFSTIRYSEVWSRWDRQSKLLVNSVIVGGSSLTLGVLLATYALFSRRSSNPPPASYIGDNINWVSWYINYPIKKVGGYLTSYWQ